jgi:hypothetical protein
MPINVQTQCAVWMKKLGSQSPWLKFVLQGSESRETFNKEFPSVWHLNHQSENVWVGKVITAPIPRRAVQPLIGFERFQNLCKFAACHLP